MVVSDLPLDAAAINTEWESNVMQVAELFSIAHFETARATENVSSHEPFAILGMTCM